MKKLVGWICSLSMLSLTWIAGAETTCCTAPDNGQGTATLPPVGCSYGNPNERKMIIDGLPPGTTIQIAETLWDFRNILPKPGGSLGGEITTFIAADNMQMTGTAALDGFTRDLTLTVQCETHTAPRIPDDPVQTFDTVMFRLSGQLPPGDPDFDLLRITAGTYFGLPSPGHTTLTRLPGGDWNVDSFFDITYRIDFVGAPGSPLAGMSGSTTGTIRMTTCSENTVAGGQDCYDLGCSASSIDFSQAAIPPDFFDPGSEPFDGVIMLGGGNPDPGQADTIVQRLRNFDLPLIGPSDTVPVELVQLRLVSCQPITVTSNGGQNPQLWDIHVTLSPTSPSSGQMTAIKTHDHGGTFWAEFSVRPVFTFTRVGNPGDVRILDNRQFTLSSGQGYPWQDTSPKPNPPCEGNGFYPTPEQPIRMSTPFGDLVLVLQPPKPTSPYTAVDTKPQWNEALQNQRITPMTPAEWDDYMGQWQTHLQTGTQPYPSNVFSQPDLYAWDPEEICPTDPTVHPAWPDSAGLVMAWHDEQTAPGSYSAAWKYVYPADPDLSNVVITVTVNPPCAGINTVSLGLKDINGNIRAWHWNVPATLPCGVPTAISIDTSIAAPAAGTPVADGYMSNPNFDITQVIELLFDENCQWVAGAGVPPPGQTLPRAWNYWYDLLITPKPVKTLGHLKWSQPVVEITPGVILGWDEKSLYYERPLMADDWECKDHRPVTDIHWWGSFLNWMEPEPPQLPIAFHFGIWSDEPKNLSDLKSFSHPNVLLWEYTCDNYQWNFAGYDKDPRTTADSDVTNSTADGFNPTVHDSCFQFYCDLRPEEWFYQQPTAFNKGRVYWLSIAAVYTTGIPVEYPWGWKTRPKFYNDDAVRILQLQDGGWPPAIGAKWLSGNPVEYPRGISWDLAFELTTNAPPREIPILDINGDGIVNIQDWAFFADQWLLRTTP